MRIPSWRRWRLPPVTTCWSNSYRPRLDEILLDGVPGCGAPRSDAQLRIDRPKVGVDSAGADAELLGELPVGPAAGDEPKDLDLARGQAVGPGASRHGDITKRRLGAL